MKYFFAICCMLTTLVFQSCDKDIAIEDVESEVEYVVTSQSPDVEFHVAGTGLDPNEGIYAKSEFSHKVKTKDYFAVVDVTCSDPHALLKVSLYVNRKHEGDYVGNEKVLVSKRIKGKGPYLQ